MLNRFLRTDIGEIRIFSRDEKKQDDMRQEFQVKMPDVAEKIKFYIGDVRDIASVRKHPWDDFTVEGMYHVGDDTNKKKIYGIIDKVY